MIKVDNLHFAYRKNRETIDGVSFDIADGSWVSIVGHNGSGKSTLAKLLVGLEVASSGTIYVDDLLMSEENIDAIRAKIGIVFQNPDNQFVGATVRHDIAFGMENRQIPKEEMEKRVIELATLVGMQDFLGKEPHLLSGGQKQKVAIAGALACDQKYIIFDEATSMLDPEGVEAISQLITKINKEQEKTIITITHDLDFALKSDHVIVLNEGKIILQGKPQDVFVQEEILKASQLNIPFGLDLYNRLLKNKIASKNEKLVKSLWEFNLKM